MMCPNCHTKIEGVPSIDYLRLFKYQSEEWKLKALRYCIDIGFITGLRFDNYRIKKT